MLLCREQSVWLQFSGSRSRKRNVLQGFWIVKRQENSTDHQSLQQQIVLFEFLSDPCIQERLISQVAICHMITTKASNQHSPVLLRTRASLLDHHFIKVVQRTVIIFCLEPYIISQVSISQGFKTFDKCSVCYLVIGSLSHKFMGWKQSIAKCVNHASRSAFRSRMNPSASDSKSSLFHV